MAKLNSLFIRNITVKANKPEQIWNGGAGIDPFIFNNDVQNTLFIGPKQDALSQNQSSCIPVPPLGGQAWPDAEIWVFSPNTINVLVVPGAKAWAPSPVQVQLALNAAGLAKDTSVNSPSYGPITTVNPGLISTEATLGTRATENTLSTRATETTLSTRATETTLGTRSAESTQQVVRDRVAQPGSTVAGDVSVTGAPLLHFETAVNNGSTGALAAGASATNGAAQAVNGTSYELLVTLTAGAGAGIINGQITVSWFRTGGVQIAQKTFSVVGSTGGHKVTITGPVRGAQVQVTFTNASTSLTTINFTWNLSINSRLAANDLCRTMSAVGAGPPTTVTWSGVSNMDSGVLGNATPNVGAGATATRGLAMYNGPVQLCVVTNSGTNDCEVVVNVFDTTVAVNTVTIFRGFTDAKGRLNALFNMPMVECQLQLTNNNVAAQTISFLIMSAEPNVN